jgi:probable HAF family extracellular repeat protein
VVAALSLTLSLTAATASPRDRAWSITDLGLGDWSSAQAINNRGQIVGTRSVPFGQGAFLWQDGVVTDITVGFASLPRDINDRGEIVGNYWNASFGDTHGFLWRDGVVTEIGDPGELGLGQFGSVAGINRRGQVVGHTHSLPGKPGYRAFLWQDGAFTYLGDLGSGFSIAEAINDRGEVVGYSATPQGVFHAVLWRDGAMLDLGATLSGPSVATDINNRGEVVVGYFGDSVAKVFHWQDGVLTSLGTGYAYGINKSGQVVGRRDWDGVGNRATLWDAGIVTELGTLGGSSAAHAINDHGQVVGTSTSSTAYDAPTRAVQFSRK